MFCCNQNITLNTPLGAGEMVQWYEMLRKNSLKHSDYVQ